MTSERKKSIAILATTLVVGILLGLLVPGFFHKYRGGNERGRGGRDHGPEHKKEWFTGTIYRIVKPDITQAKQIKPITEWASQQIEAVETSSNERLSAIMDSVKVQLKPILNEEQLQRLNDFDSKAKGHWKGGQRGNR